MGSLSEHGTFSIRVVDRVLVVHGTGTWNETTASRFQKEISGLARILGQEPWAVCYLAKDWLLVTPDSVSLAQETTRRFDRMGRTHTAVVLPEAFMELVREQLELAFCAGKRVAELDFFATEDEAFTWLRAAGFEISS